jgi:hypothetical protein
MENTLELLLSEGFKLDRYEELVEKDYLDDQEEEECQGIIGNADKIYSSILEYGKEVAKDPSNYGITPSVLEIYIHNTGVIKGDIDFEKELSKNILGENIYPNVPKIEPLLDEKVKEFLFSTQ